MEDTTKEGLWVLFFGVIAVAALALAVATLMVAWTNGPQLITSWAFIVLRVLVFFAGVGLAAGAGMILPLVAYQRWANLLARHPSAGKEIARRSPALAAVALLLSEFAISAFDAGAEKNKAEALAIKGFAALSFWIANEGLLKSKYRTLGLVWWFVTIGFLVVGAMISNGWTLRELLENVQELNSVSALSLAMVTVALIVFPVIIIARNPALFEEK